MPPRIGPVKGRRPRSAPARSDGPLAPPPCPACQSPDTFWYFDPDGTTDLVCGECLRAEYGIPGGPRHAPQAA